MAEQPASGNHIKSNVFTKGMIKDLNDSSVNEQMVTHARNAMLQTNKGDKLFYTNEPANLECIDLPYKFNGSVVLKNDRHLIFSSDGTDSEIGIANLGCCEYEALVPGPKGKCLNLDPCHVVTGIVREDLRGNEEVIFNDGINPTRLINLAEIPYTYTQTPATATEPCGKKIYTDILDCEELLLYPKINVPCPKISKSINGTLPDGAYQIAVAYMIDDIKFSDYYGLSEVIHINNDCGQSAIDVEISNLDRSFDEYQLVVIGCSNDNTSVRVVGKYPTAVTNVTVSDWDNLEQEIISNEQLVVTKINYEKAENIVSTSQYAILTGLTRKKEFNVQKHARAVELEYVVHRCPSDYYKEDGKNIGYYRDENYMFHLRYLHCDGEFTKRGQIVGPDPTAWDLEPVMHSEDKYEGKIDSCRDPEPVFNWQAYNTAGDLVKEDYDKYNKNCCTRVGYGKLGFVESTEIYPDEPDVYEDLACTPIRFHKFPDECKVPRWVRKGNDTYIQILGVQAKNVPYPRYDDGCLVPGIVGYEILRSPRDGTNKTVIARGLISNVREYEERDDNGNGNVTDIVQYTNVPYNHLGKSKYFSTKPVIGNGSSPKPGDPIPPPLMDTYNFYTPHAHFKPMYKMGNELKIEVEECAYVTGKFEKEYGHPQQKLLRNSAARLAFLLGIFQVILKMMPKACFTTSSVFDVALSGGKETTSDFRLCEDELSGFGVANLATKTAHAWVSLNVAAFIALLQVIVNAAIRGAYQAAAFLPMAANLANDWLEIIYNMGQWQDYVYQYNSRADFTKCSNCVLPKNKRRGTIKSPRYLGPNLTTIDATLFNNAWNAPSVYLKLHEPLIAPTEIDNSQVTIGNDGFCKSPTDTIESQAVMYYATSKIKNPNQYGSVEQLQIRKTSACVHPISKDESFEPVVFFGGDCIIYRHRVNKKQMVFTDTMSNKGFKDGVEWKYQIQRNIGHPIYWADFSTYDVADWLQGENLANYFTAGIITSSPSNINPPTPNQKYNLDCGVNGLFIAKNGYMYTSINGVLDFFVEADYNISFREHREEDDDDVYQPHFSDTQSNLSHIFRSDRIRKPEAWLLDDCYKRLSITQILSLPFTEFSGMKLTEPNSLIYSLPQTNTQKFNNWRYFLPGNKYVFDEGEFGRLTGMHSLDQDQVIFLFSKSSPYISPGRDTLETDAGRKVIIGDGGLFAQRPKELLHTDVAYGSNHDKYAFRSTQSGHYYVSSKQGKIFQYQRGLKEISKQGLEQWCHHHLPFKIKECFKDFDKTDCLLEGVGYLISFDNINSTIYFSKRDYCCKEEYKDSIIYDKDTNKFSIGDKTIKLGNPKYFDDASVTLSYSPTISETGGFISFHDWHPDWVIQEERNFFTVKGNKIYSHNSRCDLYCNYYGKDYPYELEHTYNGGQNVTKLRSVEFINEIYINNSCIDKDRYHVHDQTFDQVEVHNSEQHSGKLNLIYDDDQFGLEYEYPKILNDTTSSIPYSKREQKYRFNMFCDLTKDRGQFTNNTQHMWDTHCNGYIREVRPEYLDMRKDSEEAHYFRHYFHSVLFRRTVCNNLNFINKLTNFKLRHSKI